MVGGCSDGRGVKSMCCTAQRPGNGSQCTPMMHRGPALHKQACWHWRAGGLAGWRVGGLVEARHSQRGVVGTGSCCAIRTLAKAFRQPGAEAGDRDDDGAGSGCTLHSAYTSSTYIVQRRVRTPSPTPASICSVPTECMAALDAAQPISSPPAAHPPTFTATARHRCCCCCCCCSLHCRRRLP